MAHVCRVGTIVLLAAAIATSAQAEERYGFVDIYGVEHDERVADNDLTFGARVGLGFPLAQTSGTRYALELGVFGNKIENDAPGADSQLGAMLDLAYAFELGRVDPFVFAGLGAVQEDSGLVENIYPALEAGLGAEWGFSRGRALRAGLSAMEVFNDEVTSQDAYVDYRFSVGFRAPFGEPPPPPAPPRPADSDGDGVPDSADRCPAQPAPTDDGCPAPLAPAQPPRDTDGDGIDDSKDECPGTLSGLKVDGSGCVAAGAAQSIVLKGVNFLPSSAELTADAKKVLDETSASLAGQSGLKVEVGGHTDASGADAANMALSQRRAESVRQYLIGKGVAADRLVAKGYGETQPIADNKTAVGRGTNRRVELKILD